MPQASGDCTEHGGVNITAIAMDMREKFVATATKIYNDAIGRQ